MQQLIIEHGEHVERSGTGRQTGEEAVAGERQPDEGGYRQHQQARATQILMEQRHQQEQDQGRTQIMAISPQRLAALAPGVRQGQQGGQQDGEVNQLGQIPHDGALQAARAPQPDHGGTAAQGAGQKGGLAAQHELGNGGGTDQPLWPQALTAQTEPGDGDREDIGTIEQQTLAPGGAVTGIHQQETQQGDQQMKQTRPRVETQQYPHQGGVGGPEQREAGTAARHHPEPGEQDADKQQAGQRGEERTRARVGLG